MGDMSIFREGDRRFVDRLVLCGRSSPARRGCSLDQGRGGGSGFAREVAPDHAQERFGLCAQFQFERVTRQRVFPDDLGHLEFEATIVTFRARFFEQRRHGDRERSEEHTSELQSLMRISYAVSCLKKKTTHLYNSINTSHTL